MASPFYEAPPSNTDTVTLSPEGSMPVPPARCKRERPRKVRAKRQSAVYNEGYDPPKFRGPLQAAARAVPAISSLTCPSVQYFTPHHTVIFLLQHIGSFSQ